MIQIFIFNLYNFPLCSVKYTSFDVLIDILIYIKFI